MYARPASGLSQEGSAAWERCDGMQGENENAEEPWPTLVPHQTQFQQHQQLQLQHQHEQEQQFQQHDPDEPPIPQPSSPPPTDTLLPETSTRLSPGQTVEKLARKLSKQNLRLSRSSHAQPQTQPTPQLSASTPSVEYPEFRSQGWGGYGVGRQPQQHLPSPSEYHTNPWLPIPTLDVGEPIEIDEEYLDKPDDKRLVEVRRPRRQTSGHLRGSTNTRPINPRLEDMIADGTQCTVRSEPPPTPAPASAPPTSSGSTIAADPAFIEADPDCAMPHPELDPDDPDAGTTLPDIAEDLLDLGEGSNLPLRYASGPGGIRKYTVGGIALRYRLSADAALRCPNVVRSRPRMRKRHKTRHGSATSSAVTSAVNSPVLPSAPSPTLPPATHHRLP